MRRALLLVSTMALVVLVAAGVALAEIRVGTDGPETLRGTNSADHLTGMGGEDTLVGKAGNHTYHFDDGWGSDTLAESAFVKVGKKKRPGGIDTLDFSEYSGIVYVHMIPQWVAQSQSNNQIVVYGTNDESVDLGTSRVENAVGGLGYDRLTGGSAKNTYDGGPGGSDVLADYGGDDGSAVGAPDLPDLPASDDTYKGFTSAIGNDGVRDYGGTRDVLDLRPLESSEVTFEAFDSNADGTNDSLKIVIDAITSVTVAGHSSPIYPGQENGRMEQIIFADETITNAAELNSLM